MVERRTPRSSSRRAPPAGATILAPEETPTVEAPITRREPAGEGRLVDEGEIGAGGSGSVRRSYDPTLRRVVATKVLSPDLAKNPANRQRFVEEARLMALLDHPNIVPVHGLLVEEPETAYFTMKLVRGRTLEAAVESEMADPSGTGQFYQYLSAFLKICDALAFAHSRRIIHCDVKPSNIMVGEFGEAYLMDWGIASRQPAAGEAPVSSTRRSVRGTPAFMAPEQARGRLSDVTERTDVFGLGAVLYFILTGRAPFEGKTATQALARAKAARYKDPEEVAKVPPPPGLARIVRKAMALEPRDRHESVTDLRDSVNAVLQSDWKLPTKIFSPGSVIVAEGEWADAAYIIVRGHCRVSKLVEGERRVLRTLLPGEVFGETGILSGNSRTATVEAIDEVTTKVVNRELFRGELGNETWLGKFVMALADRFRELDARLASQGDRGK